MSSVGGVVPAPAQPAPARPAPAPAAPANPHPAQPAPAPANPRPAPAPAPAPAQPAPAAPHPAQPAPANPAPAPPAPAPTTAAPLPPASATTIATTTSAADPSPPQQIPNVGDTSSTNNATGNVSTSGKGGSSSFPPAAIIAISVVLAIVGIFAAYRIYRICYRRRHRNQAALPIVRSILEKPVEKIEDDHMPPTDPMHMIGYSQGHDGSYTTLHTPTDFGNDSRRASSMMLEAGPAGVLGSLGGGESSPTEESLPDGVARQTLGHQASMNPYGQPGASSRSSVYSSTGSRLHPAPFGRQSVYAMSLNSLPVAPGGSNNSRSNSRPVSIHTGVHRRMSGAPHNNISRIEIVAPSPLGAPPGAVTASDKSTLNFTPLSGIGTEVNDSRWLEKIGRDGSQDDVRTIIHPRHQRASSVNGAGPGPSPLSRADDDGDGEHDVGEGGSGDGRTESNSTPTPQRFVSPERRTSNGPRSLSQTRGRQSMTSPIGTDFRPSLGDRSQSRSTHASQLSGGPFRDFELASSRSGRESAFGGSIVSSGVFSAFEGPVPEVLTPVSARSRSSSMNRDGNKEKSEGEEEKYEHGDMKTEVINDELVDMPISGEERTSVSSNNGKAPADTGDDDVPIRRSNSGAIETMASGRRKSPLDHLKANLEMEARRARSFSGSSSSILSGGGGGAYSPGGGGRRGYRHERAGSAGSDYRPPSLHLDEMLDAGVIAAIDGESGAYQSRPGRQ